MSGLGLTFLRRGGQAHPTAGSDYIKFKDEEVFNILMSKGVSTDGVGITYDDASRVSNISTWFRGSTITSFEELEYFTNVKTLYSQAFLDCKNLTIVTSSHITSMNGDYHFHSCSSLREVRIPNCTNIAGYDFQQVSSLQILEINAVKSVEYFSLYHCINLGGQFNKEHLTSIGYAAMSDTAITSLIVPSIITIGGGDLYNSAVSNCKSLTIVDLGASCTSIGDYAFNGCTALQSFICRAITPPTLGTNGLNNTNSCPIYVPDASVDAYKAAANWSGYASRIKPLSEYNG